MSGVKGKHPYSFIVSLLLGGVKICYIIYRKVWAVYYQKTFGSFGKGTSITLPAIIISGKQYIQIGVRTYIGKHARIEAVSEYASRKFTPRLIIGDDVCINQNFHCTCADSVVIGNGTSITANCGIFDIIHPYADITLNPRMAVIQTRPVRIGHNCLIGMNSVILPGTTLGDHCVVGCNTTVSGTFPSYTVLAGSPARIIKRYDFSTKEWKRTHPDGTFIGEK